MSCEVFLFTIITSGNRTPGSRSYSDLVDTWEESVCIHQLLLEPCAKSASTMTHSNQCTVALRIHRSSQYTLRMDTLAPPLSRSIARIDNVQSTNVGID